MTDTTVYDFHLPLERRGTSSIKWDHSSLFFPTAPADALPYWVADMDFPVARPILDAMQARLGHPAFGYSVHRTSAYVEAVTGWFGRRFGWEVAPEELLFSPGVVMALALSIRAFTRPGDGVLIQRPVYRPFFAIVEANGRRVVNNALVIRDGRYEIDFEDFEAKVRDPGTTLFLLCSPHNPTGRVFTDVELSTMAGLCARHGVRMVSDEIHGDIVRRGVTHRPLTAAVPSAAPISLVAAAPSKTFNIPGLHMSSVIAHDETLRRGFHHELESLFIHGGTVFGGVAALAAYEAGEPWLEQLLGYLDGNVALMEEYLRHHHPGIGIHHPEGTYLMWLDLRELGVEEEVLMERFLQEGHIILSPGTTFGPEGRGFFRFNFACPRPQLEEGLARFTRALATL